jgi:hypothetical protein
MTKFAMTRDINGYNGFGLEFTTDNARTTLAANVEQTLAVPTRFKQYLALFSISPGSNVFVNLNATAVIPGGTFDADLSELLPVGRTVNAADVLHFITADTTNPYVNVQFYGLGQGF